MFSVRALSFTAFVFAIGASSPVYAQRGVGDWTTSGFDAQRSFWVRGDAKIYLDTMRKPGFELVWKLDLKDSLTPPVLLDFYISYRGFRSLAFMGGASETVTAVDTDLARIEWTKSLKTGAGATRGSAECPGGMTSAVTRPTPVGYPPAAVGRGTGRGTPAKSAVSEPLQGAVTIRPSTPAPAKPRAVVDAAAARRTAVAESPYAPRRQMVYALTSDGKLHAMFVSNGEEPDPAIPFLAPNANAQGLIVANGVAYVTTVNGCGGVENGIWALDLESKQVTHWKSAGSGSIASPAPAFGPDGTLYVAAGGELTALEAKTLKPKGSYRIEKGTFTSPVIVMDYQGKDLLAAASNDGRLHLVDGATLASTTTPATAATTAAAPGVNGALASWQDEAGVRWLLGPTKDGVVAWKVAGKDAALALQPGWTSSAIAAPLTPIVVDNVIFAASRGSRSKGAVLYALEAGTGKELWNSGGTIKGQVGSSGLAAGGSHVYIANQEGTQYVFGFPIEH